MTPRTRIAFAAAAFCAFALTGCAGQTDAAPAATSTSTSSATPSSNPTPTATPTPPPQPVAATCENTSTPEFQAAMADSGWVSWTLPYNGIGASMFDRFPGGAPDGAIACRWGADPDLATDNLVDLDWAPIDPASAAAAQAFLIGEGYQKSTTDQGTLLRLPGEGGYGDADGFGDAYLFTATDVRWAMFTADLDYITAP